MFDTLLFHFQRALVHSNLSYRTLFVDIQMRSACLRMRFPFILCSLKLVQTGFLQFELPPANQSDFCKVLTALLEIPTMSQLFIDTDEMHHIPMMESSIVLVKITFVLEIQYFSIKMIFVL